MPAVGAQQRASREGGSAVGHEFRDPLRVEGDQPFHLRLRKLGLGVHPRMVTATSEGQMDASPEADAYPGCVIKVSCEACGWVAITSQPVNDVWREHEAGCPAVGGAVRHLPDLPPLRRILPPVNRCRHRPARRQIAVTPAGVKKYAALYSTKEYKKSRVRYFTGEIEAWEASHRHAAA